MIRNTKQRQDILKIFQDGSLLTASEISTVLPTLNRATVYRTINRLVKDGVLREVSIHKGVMSYELRDAEDHHQHFICQDCHTVLPIEVDEDKLSRLLPKHIHFSEIELNLKGQCDDCTQT